jgi:hypothetical protein
MQKIPAPSGGKGKVSGRVVALAAAIAGVAALIAFFLGRWHTGAGDGPAASQEAPKPPASNDKDVVKVRVVERECALQQGSKVACAEVCAALKARDDKDKIIVEIDITDGLVNQIQEVKDCLYQADMKFTTTRR